VATLLWIGSRPKFEVWFGCRAKTKLWCGCHTNLGLLPHHNRVVVRRNMPALSHSNFHQIGPSFNWVVGIFFKYVLPAHLYKSRNYTTTNLAPELLDGLFLLPSTQESGMATTRCTTADHYLRVDTTQRRHCFHPFDVVTSSSRNGCPSTNVW
jgi:hypothetical protein